MLVSTLITAIPNTQCYKSYPSEEGQVEAAGHLQQLQRLRGRAEGEGDLETIVRVKHQLGGPVAVLQHGLQRGADGTFRLDPPDGWTENRRTHLDFAHEGRRHPLLKIVDGRVGVQNLHDLQTNVPRNYVARHIQGKQQQRVAV